MLEQIKFKAFMVEEQDGRFIKTIQTRPTRRKS